MDEDNQDTAPAVPAVFVQITQTPLRIPLSASLVVCVPLGCVWRPSCVFRWVTFTDVFGALRRNGDVETMPGLFAEQVRA